MGTADGFVPFVARWWEPIVEVLLESNLQWPEEAAYFDLRWWHDYSRHKAGEGVRFPGSRFFADRWGWKRNQVRKLLETDEGRALWMDPKFLPSESDDEEEVRPPPARRSPAPRPGRNGSTVTTGEDSPGVRPVVARSSPALSTLETPEHRGSSRVRARVEELPLEERDDPSPKWVKTWLKGDGRKLSASPLEVYGALGSVLEVVKGRPRKPSESAARPILRLWREALEVGRVEDLESARRVGCLLARAALDCPDAIFRNDIRGLRTDGSSWKKDTSRTPSAVFRLAPPPTSSGATWEDRLDAAESWEASGFPSFDPDSPTTPPPRGGRGGGRSAADRLFED